MERDVFIASALNAKVHLLSGIVIGAGAILLMKQMCKRKHKSHNSMHAPNQPMPAVDTKAD